MPANDREIKLIIKADGSVAIGEINSVGESTKKFGQSANEAASKARIFADALGETGSGANKAKISLDQMVGDLDGLKSKMLESIGITDLVKGKLGEVWDFAKERAEINETKQVFTVYAASVGNNASKMVESFKIATEGTVSETELMKSSMRSMQQHVSTDTETLSKLWEIAKAKAHMGFGETAQIFDRMSEAIARGNGRALVSLGFLPESMNRAANSADLLMKREEMLSVIMSQGAETMEIVKRAGGSCAESFDRFTNSVKELKGAFDDFLPFLAPVVDGLAKFVSLAGKLPKIPGNLGTMLGSASGPQTNDWVNPDITNPNPLLGMVERKKYFEALLKEYSKTAATLATEAERDLDTQLSTADKNKIDLIKQQIGLVNKEMQQLSMDNGKVLAQNAKQYVIESLDGVHSGISTIFDWYTEGHKTTWEKAAKDGENFAKKAVEEAKKATETALKDLKEGLSEAYGGNELAKGLRVGLGVGAAAASPMFQLFNEASGKGMTKGAEDYTKKLKEAQEAYSGLYVSASKLTNMDLDKIFNSLLGTKNSGLVEELMAFKNVLPDVVQAVINAGSRTQKEIDTLTSDERINRQQKKLDDLKQSWKEQDEDAWIDNLAKMHDKMRISVADAFEGGLNDAMNGGDFFKSFGDNLKRQVISALSAGLTNALFNGGSGGFDLSGLIGKAIGSNGGGGGIGPDDVAVGSGGGFDFASMGTSLAIGYGVSTLFGSGGVFGSRVEKGKEAITQASQINEQIKQALQQKGKLLGTLGISDATAKAISDLQLASASYSWSDSGDGLFKKKTREYTLNSGAAEASLAELKALTEKAATDAAARQYQTTVTGFISPGDSIDMQISDLQAAMHRLGYDNTNVPTQAAAFPLMTQLAQLQQQKKTDRQNTAASYTDFMFQNQLAWQANPTDFLTAKASVANYGTSQFTVDGRAGLSNEQTIRMIGAQQRNAESVNQQAGDGLLNKEIMIDGKSYLGTLKTNLNEIQEMMDAAKFASTNKTKSLDEQKYALQRYSQFSQEYFKLNDTIMALEKADAEKATQTTKEADAAKLALSSQKRSLDIQLMEAAGDSAGAKAAQRADTLASLDESLRATQQAIYDAQDKNNDQSISDAKAALDRTLAWESKWLNLAVSNGDLLGNASDRAFFSDQISMGNVSEKSDFANLSKEMDLLNRGAASRFNRQKEQLQAGSDPAKLQSFYQDELQRLESASSFYQDIADRETAIALDEARKQEVRRAALEKSMTAREKTYATEMEILQIKQTQDDAVAKKEAEVQAKKEQKVNDLLTNLSTALVEQQKKGISTVYVLMPGQRDEAAILQEVKGMVNGTNPELATMMEKFIASRQKKYAT